MSQSADSGQAHTGQIRLTDYRAALTAPGARWPVLASLLGRLPIAMIAISAMLYTQREMGSFALAGVVSASILIGVAIASVAQGRIVDKLGPTRPLLVLASVFLVASTALILAIDGHAAEWLLVILAFLVGASEPMVASPSRALWMRLVPAGSVRAAAYAYEAISMEVFFILGPGIAGLLIGLPWPGLGLAIGAGCMAAGAVAFALSPAARAWRGEPDAPAKSLLGALASTGMRTLTIAAFGFGVVIGFVEVAVPASATNAGVPTVGGLLLGLWSLSSVVCGVLYGLRPWPRPMHLRLPVLLGGFGILVTTLAIPDSLWALAGFMLLAGVLITPQATAHSATVELVAPRGTMTEAFGWVITAVTLGLAAGQSVSGTLVEHAGPWLSFLAAGLSGLLLAGVVWSFRRTVAKPKVAGSVLAPVG
nr:MFS transporter [Tamaricihabitans halophyticus]